ncbi:hypothetical protein [Moraxella oblonga]|uniref:hypothetical protein n=1 Tax=Moraxella oblonga TaxID=200413 RepID=UPI00082BB573|nr:hypothetical protein [Moraxella oblonga]
MKKLIALALCALPYVAFAGDVSDVPEPIIIKKQTVSHLPKELYDGWWVTYDTDNHVSYAMRFYLENGKVQGEHHSFDCSDKTLIEQDTFQLTPTAKKGFNLQFNNQSDFASYMNFSAISPKTFLLANQSFGNDEMVKMFPHGMNWIYLHSDVLTAKCPNS